MGVDSAEAGSLTVHNSFPLLVSKARKRPSLVAPTNVRPPAVTIAPPSPGRPVFCLPGGKLSVTPSVVRHAILPVFTSTATNWPQGDGVQGRWSLGFQKRVTPANGPELEKL